MDSYPNNYGENQWVDINLKTFFAVLALTNPDVKQSQIAEDLGIAPATLSRIINGTYGDGKMRMEWTTALKPYLMSIDMRRLSGELQVIESLQNYYDSETRHALVKQIISTYPKGSNWSLNSNWTKPNSLLFYGTNSSSWFLFDLMNEHTVGPNIKDIIEHYKGYINLDLSTRFSFLCYDETTFNKCVDYLNSSVVSSLLAKNGVKFSAMWIDIPQKQLSGEYFLHLEL